MRDLISWKKNEIATLRNQMEELFNRFFDQLSCSCFTPGAGPFTDWQFDEDEHRIHLRIDLPDTDPDDIDISIAGEMLTVRSKREEVAKQGENAYTAERKSTLSSARSVSLPSRVKRDDIEARYSNGVLEIILPKLEKTAVKVEVKGEE
jgi:HSP20 family protein